MKKKKITLLLAVLFLAFAFLACGGGVPEEPYVPDTEQENNNNNNDNNDNNGDNNEDNGLWEGFDREFLQEFMGDFPASSRHVYVIRDSDMTPTEFVMITSLQGIVAKTQPSIYIDIIFYRTHLDFMVENLEHTYTYVDNPWDLAVKFSDHIAPVPNGQLPGFVMYAHPPNNANNSINAAATIAGLENWLMVAVGDRGRAEEAGFAIAHNATIYTSLMHMQELFEREKHRLNRNHALHQPPTMRFMRDLSISLGAFTFYTLESTAERTFRRRVFEWMEPNTPVWGWTEDELAFVEDLSRFGNFVLPADWSSNFSYLAGVRTGGPIEQPYVDRHITPEQGQHFVTIVVSDGDNMQWVSRDFAGNPNTFFGNRISRHNDDVERPDYRMSWTFTPSMGEIGEVVVRNIYSRTNAERDSFVAGVSGVGYGNPMTFPIEYLPQFADSTARHMTNTGLSVITMLDDITRMYANAEMNGLSIDEFAANRLYYFARHEQIRGGLWQMDPGRYEAGRGRVFWSNDKPFVSVRLSLWHPDSSVNHTNNNDLAWLRSYANRINGFARDYRSIDGYTLLNIHPWTVNLDNLDYLVSNLGDHVQIVSAGEFIDLISRYVPRENRQPGNQGILP